MSILAVGVESRVSRRERVETAPHVLKPHALAGTPDRILIHVVLHRKPERSIDHHRRHFHRTTLDPLRDPVLNLAGQTTLRELCAALKLCLVVVTNDSGPMHIAAAMNRPLVSLFGPTNPTRTGVLEALRAMGASIESVTIESAAGSHAAAEPFADLVARGGALRGIEIYPPRGIYPQTPAFSIYEVQLIHDEAREVPRSVASTFRARYGSWRATWRRNPAIQ